MKKLIWMTGLSGSGKTTIGKLVTETCWWDEEPSIYLLDGDVLRKGLCSDLGFSLKDRKENIRRASEVARILCDAGKIVIASFICPTNELRKLALSKFTKEESTLVWVKAPLDVCENRDPKGLYKAARAGKITGFTGIDSPFESPKNLDHKVLDTVNQSPQDCARILRKIIFE